MRSVWRMLNTISDVYRDLNTRLHREREGYGASGKRWSKEVLKLSEELSTKDILDYGCGKSSLADMLDFPISQYDPCVVEYSKHPVPADIVVCTDVLEHIEPEFIDNVLDDLKNLTIKSGFFCIGLGLSKKKLADGRNANLLVKPIEWWREELEKRFTLTEIKVFTNPTPEFTVIVVKK